MILSLLPIKIVPGESAIQELFIIHFGSDLNLEIMYKQPNFLYKLAMSTSSKIKIAEFRLNQRNKNRNSYQKEKRGKID